MKIAIDAHCIGKNLAGNQTYTVNLIRNFLSLYPQHEWFIYVSSEGRELSAAFGNAKVRVLRSNSALERYSREMPALLKEDKPDVLHIQYHGPIFCNCRKVLMVHDISYELFPEYFTFAERLRLKLAVPYFIRNSSRVITVSESSRKAIVERYKVPEEKVTTIHNGVDHDFFFAADDTEDTRLLRGLDINKPYLLFVGSLQPRKNIEGLLMAADNIYPLLSGMEIIIAGPMGWLAAGIEKVLSSHTRLRSIVRFTGHVQAPTLRALYRRCTAFIYVPFYEGFGLPVLEAMACGAPAITSNVSSLPEVSGKAAILVGPEDTMAISETIKKVISNPELRKDMAGKGIERARNFNWHKTAEETFSVLEKAANDSRR